MKRIVVGIAALAAGLTMALPAQAAKNVKVTPLGSVDGEFCRLDRALIFEVHIVLFQAINFHHYVVDSQIWKARKKANRQALGIAM